MSAQLDITDCQFSVLGTALHLSKHFSDFPKKTTKESTVQRSLPFPRSHSQEGESLGLKPEPSRNALCPCVTRQPPVTKYLSLRREILYGPEGWNPGVEVIRTPFQLSKKTFPRVRWKGDCKGGWQGCHTGASPTGLRELAEVTVQALSSLA